MGVRKFTVRVNPGAAFSDVCSEGEVRQPWNEMKLISVECVDCMKIVYKRS